MRLIDADAIKEKIDDIWDGRPLSFLGARILAMIDKAPTIDADRPQGYWTKTDVATYRCSECGKIQTADDVNELNFCCCCGSRNKMRRLKGADDE